MRILDGCCMAGGAGRGYRDAGFEVVGVDIAPQPHYPFGFVQADILDVLADREFLASFDAIHVSPPCHDHTDLVARCGPDGTGYLVGAVRELLAGQDAPWIIENTPRAPLRDPVMLCGTMFGLECGGFELRRHRLFEVSGFPRPVPPPCDHRKRALGVYGHGGGQGSQAKGIKATAEQARQIMGIGWMSGRELAQAVPPAYTAYLGGHLAAELAGVT